MVRQENEYQKLNIKLNKRTFYCPECGSVVHIPHLYTKIDKLYNKYRKENIPSYKGTNIVLWGECSNCGNFIDYYIECHNDEILGFSAYLRKIQIREKNNKYKEQDFMKKENKTIVKNIKLEQISDIHAFITLMSSIENKIDVCSEGYVVNGKSVMGIYSLNLSKPFRIEIYDEVSSSFLNAVKEFVA